jgi:type IV pilus assembly protein PilC
MPSIETLAAINFEEPQRPSEAPARNTSGQSAAGTPSWGSGEARLKRAELIQLSAQLAVMLETGVTISDALECVGQQADKPNVRSVIEQVAAAVGRGDDFSTAVGRQPRSFPRIFVALMRASERSGMLPRMIVRANAYLRDELEIIRRVRGAMTYPAIMLCFALATCVMMLAFVLPRFTVLYKGKEHLLPVPTKVLLAMSSLLTEHWMYLLPGTAAAVLVLWSWLSTESGQEAWHRLQLRLPLAGPMFKKLHLSRGLRLIGTLAGAGVNLVDCLENAEALAGNRLYGRLWNEVGGRIRQGQPFSDALRNSPLVPPAVAQMLHSGESAGKLSLVMERVAEHSEEELKQLIAELTRYIEPAMIVVMGGLIGGITMAMLLPVFTVSRVMVH